MSLLSVVIPTNQLDLDIAKFEKWMEDLDPKEWEIIIVVDELAREFHPLIKILAEKYTTTNLTIIKGAYGNPGSARNAGLNHVTGKWVIFWDSDDLPNPQATRRMVNRAVQVNADLAIGSFTVNSEVHKTPITKLGTISNLKLVTHLFLNPGLWRICFKADLIKGILFPELRMGEDQAFISQIDMTSKRILISDEIVYNYSTSNPNSLTNTHEAVADLYKTIKFVSSKILEKNTNGLGGFLLLKINATYLLSLLRNRRYKTAWKSNLLTLKTFRVFFYSLKFSKFWTWTVTP